MPATGGFHWREARPPIGIIFLSVIFDQGGAMIILRQRMRAKPDTREEVMAALAAIPATARATQGVVSLDIARDLLDPDAFVATGIYEDGAALERQESAPEVHKAMAMFAESLAAAPERTLYDASVNPTLV
jgi:quinol monooxygenase YgiN